jgi:hypothetical protein
MRESRRFVVTLPDDVKGKSLEWEYAFKKHSLVEYEGVSCAIEVKTYDPAYNNVIFHLTEIFTANKENCMENLKIDVRELSVEQKENVFKAGYELTGYTINTRNSCYYFIYPNDFMCHSYNDHSFANSKNTEVTYNELMEIAGMSDKKAFTKADLKTGMIVEFKSGEKAIVLLGTDNGDIVCGDTWFPLSDYSDDVLFGSDRTVSISKVFRPTANKYFSLLEFKKDSHWTNYTKVWEYKVKTQAEIELEKLQQQIAELTAQANKLQQTL